MSKKEKVIVDETFYYEWYESIKALGKYNPVVSYNTFYQSWHEAMKKLNPEQYGKLAIALNEYCFYGIEPELEFPLDSLFTSYKPIIHASTSNKLNGRNGGLMGRGGAPFGNTNASRKQYPPIEQNNSNGNGNGNVNDNGDGNTHTQSHVVGECESLFLSLWKQHSDVFTNPYIIKNVEYWNSVWDTCPFSLQEIQKAMTNLAEAVRNRGYESRFISPYPDVFISGGMIQRGLDTDIDF